MPKKVKEWCEKCSGIRYWRMKDPEDKVCSGCNGDGEVDEAVKAERELILKELIPFEDQNLIIKVCADAIRARE